ncbi:MAG TPA: DUF4142 domain-containing protein [Gemmatimonadaceae bacterium]|nr:DUF4142 domain-containing protein [Gemmatimonadaceae bacterium]
MSRNTYRAGMAVLVASALFACNKSNGNSIDSAAAQGPAAAGDSGTMGRDTVAATTPDTSNAGAAGLNDASILGEEMGGDSAEVVIAKYMMANGMNASVRSYARMLNNDHSKGMTEVKTVAKQTSLTPQSPPNDTTAQETAHTLDHLKSLSGMDRDTAFVNHEVEDHQSDIANAKQAEQAAQKPQVKSLLQKALPELQKHLDRAQQLQKQLGGGASK